MLGGDSDKWPPFTEWIERLGLSDNSTRPEAKRKRKLAPQEIPMEQARIKAKYVPMAKKLREQYEKDKRVNGDAGPSN